MKIESWNEWDPLETVIIGRADGARIPRLDKSLRAINYADESDPAKIPTGPYPQQVIDEANEDLETLCAELRKLKVEVLRPAPYDTSLEISNGHWATEGYYSFCPRDSVLVHGSTIIEAPMPLRSRYLEHQMFRTIFSEGQENGAAWLSAPRPALSDDCYELENIDKTNLTLREVEPCFDAANVLRCGYDLFYLVSNSGNVRGAQWLQNALGEKFGEKFKVHLLRDIYAYMHLDSTISFIKPGLVLLNPARINENNLPEPLKTWDKIWAAEPVDIGYFKNYKNASHWIGMNLLMVNPQLAVVEQSQTPLIKQLEQKGIDVLALPMRHARTLGGAFHCVSLDLKRKGNLENYF